MRNVKFDRYSLAARVLHWVSAAVIIWATLSGLYMAAFAGPAVKQLISYINISVTSLLAPIFAARIVYAAFGKKPGPLDVPVRERQAARIGHILLYVVTSAVLASGILMMDKDIQVFDWLTIPQPLHDPQVTAVFAQIHRVTSSLLGIMIAGHVAAVVRHHRLGRPLLNRMTWAGQPCVNADHGFVTNKPAKCHFDIKYRQHSVPIVNPMICSSGETRWKP